MIAATTTSYSTLCPFNTGVDMAKDFVEASQQEPIGTVVINNVGWPTITVEWSENAYHLGVGHGSKLYATPQQRPWVGLTEEDRADAWRNAVHEAALGESTASKCFAQAIEAKLREKNE